MDATPVDLTKSPTNVYSQIAIALKGGELREPGLANLAERLSKRVPSAPAAVEAVVAPRRKTGTRKSSLLRGKSQADRVSRPRLTFRDPQCTYNDAAAGAERLESSCQITAEMRSHRSTSNFSSRRESRNSGQRKKTVAANPSYCEAAIGAMRPGDGEMPGEASPTVGRGAIPRVRLPSTIRSSARAPAVAAVRDCGSGDEASPGDAAGAIPLGSSEIEFTARALAVVDSSV